MENEYFMPLKPDSPLSFMMNFPQFEESNSSDRAMITPQISMNSNFNQSARNKSKRRKCNVEIPSKRCITRVCSGLILICVASLSVVAVYTIVFNDQEDSLFLFLHFCKTFASFRTNICLIIIYLIFYSILFLIATFSSSLGIFLNSLLLSLFGISTLLMAFGLAVIFPTIFNACKEVFIDTIERHMRMSIKDYDTNPENLVTSFWNRLQSKYSCCGINDSISDYRASSFHRLTNLHLPNSCCRSNRTSCSVHPTPDNSFLNVSCIPPIKVHFDHVIQSISLGHIILLLCLLLLINLGFIKNFLSTIERQSGLN